MPSENDVRASSSQPTAFKCCKTKVFIHSVCVKCGSVFHKSCLPRFRKDIKHLKDNKVICCEDNTEINTSEYEEERSLLEKTINDLSEDGENKNNYINKLKKENEFFVREALKSEEEFSNLIKQQQAKISELQAIIKELNKKDTSTKKDKKSKKTSSTQTTINNKTSVATSTDTIQVTSAVDVGTQTLGANKSLSNTRHLPTESTTLNKIKLLLLSDEMGQGINKKLRVKLDTAKYEVQSIVKPGAKLSQVIGDIEKLVVNYTTRDFVVILAGVNDFRSQSYPMFKDLHLKIKKCSHTNVLISMVPQLKNLTYMKYINKFNNQLSAYVQKINNYTEGNIFCLDSASKFTTDIRNHIVNKIVQCLEKPVTPKNIVFIRPLEISPPPCSVDTTPNTPIIINNDNNQHFLYPRLSQVRLIEEQTI